MVLLILMLFLILVNFGLLKRMKRTRCLQKMLKINKLLQHKMYRMNLLVKARLLELRMKLFKLRVTLLMLVLVDCLKLGLISGLLVELLMKMTNLDVQ